MSSLRHASLARAGVLALAGSLALAGWLTLAAPLAAQDDIAAACDDAPSDAAFCRVVAHGAEALLPLVVIAGAGGNPVPGTASTLGMRLTSMPRWTMGGRLTVASGNAPDLIVRDGTEDLQVRPAAFALDASVGVLPGWNPLPTVGGVASLDLLLGASVVPLLSSDGYPGFGGWSWGAGVRLGLLRESFTLPGVSISGMYRQLRSISLGDEELDDADSYVEGSVSFLSARAAATKAILLLNLTGGVGYDLVYGDVDFGYDGSGGPVRLTATDMRMERITVFGELSYTFMVLNLVIGGGWQEAAPAFDDAPGDYEPAGAIYVSSALRLSI